jgi:hypothetical protein
MLYYQTRSFTQQTASMANSVNSASLTAHIHAAGGDNALRVHVKQSSSTHSEFAYTVEAEVLEAHAGMQN